MRTDTMDYMDGCEREQYTDTITSMGIVADEAESLWAYKQWRFSVVARAAYVLALHCCGSGISKRKLGLLDIPRISGLIAV